MQVVLHHHLIVPQLQLWQGGNSLQVKAKKQQQHDRQLSLKQKTTLAAINRACCCLCKESYSEGIITVDLYKQRFGCSLRNHRLEPLTEHDVPCPHWPINPINSINQSNQSITNQPNHTSVSNRHITHSSNRNLHIVLA